MTGGEAGSRHTYESIAGSQYTEVNEAFIRKIQLIKVIFGL